MQILIFFVLNVVTSTFIVLPLPTVNMKRYSRLLIQTQDHVLDK